MSHRYAIYYAPAPNSRWWHFGSRWLGRDAVCGEPRPQYAVPGLQAEELWNLTADPRRYGFHATLKPPFVLAQSCSRNELLGAVEALAGRHRPFALGRLGLHALGEFLALMPQQPSAALQQFADDCVEQLDAFRAPPDEGELSRRRQAGLSARQEALLMRWGYPHVMDQWRFHMTLTGPAVEVKRQAMAAWLEPRLRELVREELQVDAVCLFEQATPGAAFRLTHRFHFGEAQARRSGRLFYVAGPSGAGKDSLLAYARERLSGRPIEFARRFITRPLQAGDEAHCALSEEEFASLAARGGFALHWYSHGYGYGISRDIDQCLAEGRDVVVNGSREYLDEARRRYPGLVPVWIEADPAVLRARLTGRGREDEQAVQSRLRRAESFAAPCDALRIDNNGTLQEAGERLMQLLTDGRAARPAAGREPRFSRRQVFQ